MEGIENVPFYENIWVYATLQKLFVAAESKHENCWRLLKFDRSNELHVSEDSTKYTHSELKEVLSRLDLGMSPSKFITVDEILSTFHPTTNIIQETPM